MTYTRIDSCGAFLPDNIVTNEDISKIVDTSDEWISSRTGIHQRHIITEKDTPLTMAVAAAKDAITKADIDPESIDVIIGASATPLMMFPSTACLIQNELGIQRSIIAFDVSAACAGFIYAMGIADQFIRNKMAKRVLIVGSEACSTMLDWNDRNTCVLFGDGAGAFVLSASDEPGIEDVELHSNGQKHDILYLKNRALVDTDKEACLVMDGKEVFKFAVNSLTQSAQSILERAQLSVDDIDWLIPHQANTRIIDAISKKLGLSTEKIINTLQYHGNTSSASIPLAMAKALDDGKINRGDRILFQAIGGGMVWGSAISIY